MLSAETSEQPGLDQESVREQVALLLASPHFRNSQRYPALLRYLVDQTLDGNGGKLKERLIGIEVFHRAPDYDTNAEPVVRVTAGEVRKRIAQYYHEPEHRNELRIELPLGTYVPRFVAPASLNPPLPAEAAAPSLDVSSPPAPPKRDDSSDNLLEPRKSSIHKSGPAPQDRARNGWIVLLTGLLCGMLLILGALFARTQMQKYSERAVRQFWKPMTESSQPMLIVVGNHSTDASGNALPIGAATTDIGDRIVRQFNHTSQVTISDVLALLRLASYPEQQRIPFRALSANAANLDDLRGAPVLLFAGFDNRWTLRLTQPLRYHFRLSPNDSIGVLEDSKTPGRQWIVNFNVPYRQMSEDYAIVARYHDSALEQPVIIAAGMGEPGTTMASEFVVDEHSLEAAEALAPKDWKRQNMELVLQTGVVDGHPGPAHIVAAEFW